MSNSPLHIAAHLIPNKDTTIFLAISGGVDSMVLLHLLSKLPNPIHLLHVNYHLRGEDSNADEAVVRQQVKKYKVEITVLDFDMQKHLDTHGGNLQNEARNVRYSFFQKHVGETGVLMTAHHLNDQMETFFMHLSRKSGIAGMSCMSERNDHHVRPLLNYKKSELYQYAAQNKIIFREDISNQNNKYLRNLWRNVWIPELEAKIPTLSDSIQVLIDAFQTERARLENMYAAELDTIRVRKKWSFSSFDAMSDEAKHMVIREFDIRPTELKELENLRNSGKSKKIVVERIGLTIWNSGESFVFDYKKPVDIPELKIESIAKLPAVFDKNVLYLDATKIVGELKIRVWKEGDRISSIGMKGSQLVSDIIKDAKVSVELKEGVLVVEDDEKLVWVVGLKVGRGAVARGGGEILAVLTK